MTQAEAGKMLRKLHREFQVYRGSPPPTMIWSNRVKKGKAYYYRFAIRVGPRCWRGLEASICHEFAHLLSYRRLIRGHGPHFYQCLVAVTQAHYGHPYFYPWATEYQSVKNRARKDGWFDDPRWQAVAAEKGENQ